jgi:hypothetical protein
LNAVLKQQLHVLSATTLNRRGKLVSRAPCQYPVVVCGEVKTMEGYEPFVTSALLSGLLQVPGHAGPITAADLQHQDEVCARCNIYDSGSTGAVLGG